MFELHAKEGQMVAIQAFKQLDLIQALTLGATTHLSNTTNWNKYSTEMEKQNYKTKRE